MLQIEQYGGVCSPDHLISNAALQMLLNDTSQGRISLQTDYIHICSAAVKWAAFYDAFFCIYWAMIQWKWLSMKTVPDSIMVHIAKICHEVEPQNIHTEERKLREEREKVFVWLKTIER